MTSSPRTVEREIVLAAPPAAVWRALTDARELTRWFPLDARVTPGAGGSIWMSWQELYEAESRIDVWLPERHLRFGFPAHAPMLLATDYYLEGRGGGTVLRVVTSGFGEGAEWDSMYGGVSRGWDFELLGLRHYLERHPGRDRTAAWARTAVSDPAVAWERLTGPGGWLGAAGLSPTPGGRYAVTTAAGDECSGAVLLWDPPHQLGVTVAGLGDALMRVEVETFASPAMATVWLSSWAAPADRVRELGHRWRALLPEVVGRAEAGAARPPA